MDEAAEEVQAVVCSSTRRERLFSIFSLSINEDLTLSVSLDVPPCLSPTAPPGAWPEADVAAHLAWEVRQLEYDPCPGLVSVRVAGAPAMMLDNDGEAQACMTCPPLVIEARLSTAPGTPYYAPRGLRVRLLCDQHYPASPPEINFLQTVHHFFLDNDNGLPTIFYELLTSLVGDLADDLGKPHQHTLRATLQLLHHVLQSPLHPCEGCQDQFDAYARMHLERENTLNAYASHRAHGCLFDAAAGWQDEWLHPQLREALWAFEGHDGMPGGDAEPLRAVLHECAEGVFSFPCLTDEACAMFVDEVDAYAASGLPTARPNSMNK